MELLAVTPLPSPVKNIWPSDQTEAELSVTPDPACPVPTPKRGAAIVYRSGRWPQAGSHDHLPTRPWLASGWQPWLQGQGLRGAQSHPQGRIPPRRLRGPLPACWWERYPTSHAAGCPVQQPGGPWGSCPGRSIGSHLTCCSGKVTLGQTLLLVVLAKSQALKAQESHSCVTRKQGLYAWTCILITEKFLALHSHTRIQETRELRSLSRWLTESKNP